MSSATFMQSLSATVLDFSHPSHVNSSVFQIVYEFVQLIKPDIPVLTRFVICKSPRALNKATVPTQLSKNIFHGFIMKVKVEWTLVNPGSTCHELTTHPPMQTEYTP